MVKTKKASSKNQKNSGIDFKKIKRKLGRKLPSKNNATDTQVKSKAIILPEQSVASERAGLAVSRKGLTLKELLQKTSHHNAKVRKDALNGMNDICLNSPLEIRSHIFVIMKKLCERITDENKVVRETLYQLLNLTVFPYLKEDMQGNIISLVMAYIFIAMAHIGSDVRIMAFKFFNLLLEHFPSSIISYAAKILESYENVLCNNRKYLEDKNNLKVVLDGLNRCLSVFVTDTKKSNHPVDNPSDVRRTLHAYKHALPEEEVGVSSIIGKLQDLLPGLLNFFQELFPLVCKMPSVDVQSFESMQNVIQCINDIVKILIFEMEKPHSSIGYTMHKVPNAKTWGASEISTLLRKLFQAFPLNRIYSSTGKEERWCYVLNMGIAEILLHLKSCSDNPAVLTDKFLIFFESMLSWKETWMLWEKRLVSLLPHIPRLVFHVPNEWKVRILEAFTKAFICCQPDSTLKLACLSVIEEMLLSFPRQGIQLFNDGNQEMMEYQSVWMQEFPQLLLQLGLQHPSTSRAVLHLQLRLVQCNSIHSLFVMEYDKVQENLGEFFREIVKEREFPMDLKELAICCLYYCSRLNSSLIEALAYCCLCDDMEPRVIVRTIEVMNSAYKAGRVLITDLISFLLTLIGRFKVLPGKDENTESDRHISNRAALKCITDVACSCFSQMGDHVLILKVIEKTILGEMFLKLPLDNVRAVVRVVITLDSKLTVFHEESMKTLSCHLLHYLVDTTHYIPDNIGENVDCCWKRTFQFYVQPVFILLVRSVRLLRNMLTLLVPFMVEQDSTCPSHGTECACQLTSRVCAVSFILIFMLKEAKLQQNLSLCTTTVECILQDIHKLQVSNDVNITLQERHRMQCVIGLLKVEASRMHLWNVS